MAQRIGLLDFAPRPLLDNVLQPLLPNSLQVPRDYYEINIRFPVIDEHSLVIPFLLEPMRWITVVVVERSHASIHIIGEPALIESERSERPLDLQV